VVVTCCICYRFEIKIIITSLKFIIREVCALDNVDCFLEKRIRRLFVETLRQSHSGDVKLI